MGEQIRHRPESRMCDLPPAGKWAGKTGQTPADFGPNLTHW